MHDVVLAALLITGVLIFFASLDDILVDFLTLRRVRGWKILPVRPAGEHAELPPTAVFVANWHEADVLEQMVEGNLANITNPRVRFVLGVYPNDVDTRTIAKRLAKRHPDRVQVVVNRRAGPTSKGQMLNEMFAIVFRNRAKAPKLVVIHDSEDVIAPRSFEVYAREAESHAMIQIPVFSLDARARSMVSATYMDEFAERHTREMLLRAEMGACIPSAGVGTCLTEELILHFLNKHGYVLQADSVTEDYLLGTEAHSDGFKTTFAAIKDGTSPDAPIIATLEYFPKDFWASVKQKTRWVYGIAFQGTKRIGWSGTPWDIFFLYRDRKGAIANLLPLVSLLVLVAGLLVGSSAAHLPPWQKYLLWFVLAANTLSIFVRLYFKAVSFQTVYGTHDALGIILRWPIGILINAIAVSRAWRSFVVDSRLASRPIAWAKTRHELPAVFRSITLIPAVPTVAPLGSTRLGRYLPKVHGASWNGLAAAAAVGLVIVLGGRLVLQSTFTIIDNERARVAAVEVLSDIEARERTILTLADEARRNRPLYAQLKDVQEEGQTASGSGISPPDATAEEWHFRLTEDRESARELAKLSLADASDSRLLEKIEQRRRELPVAAVATASPSDLRFILMPEDREEARVLAKQALSGIEAEATAFLETASLNRRPYQVAASGLDHPVDGQRAADGKHRSNELTAQIAATRTQVTEAAQKAIDASEHQDGAILARAAGVKTNDDPASGSEVAAPANSAASAGEAVRETSAADVRVVQQAANLWMLKHRLSVRDLGLTKMHSHCGRLLCVDGIMGPRTRHVISAIKRRDTAFRGGFDGDKGVGQKL